MKKLIRSFTKGLLLVLAVLPFCESAFAITPSDAKLLPSELNLGPVSGSFSRVRNGTKFFCPYLRGAEWSYTGVQLISATAGDFSAEATSSGCLRVSCTAKTAGLKSAQIIAETTNQEFPVITFPVTARVLNLPELTVGFKYKYKASTLANGAVVIKGTATVTNVGRRRAKAGAVLTVALEGDPDYQDLTPSKALINYRLPALGRNQSKSVKFSKNIGIVEANSSFGKILTAKVEGLQNQIGRRSMGLNHTRIPVNSDCPHFFACYK